MTDNVENFYIRISKYLGFLLLLPGIFWSDTIPSSTGHNSLNITVDPRIELLAVVQLLSDYDEHFGLITDFDFPYKRDVVEYFSPYKKHPVVKLFDEMSVSAFTYDVPPTVMLYLSNPPDLMLKSPLTDYLLSRTCGKKKLDKFIKALRDFAHRSQFMNFFMAHKGTFQTIIGDAIKNMEGIDYIGILENYHGMKQNSYNIVLASLFQMGGYGPKIQCVNGNYDVYDICGPVCVKDGFPVFGTTESLRYLVWHEFSHSFVNPITARFSDQITQYSSLFDSISDEMKDQAYSDWETCVNEHIVRAITVRLMYREVGKEAGELALQYEKNNGFVYVEALCAGLKDYEEQRDTYRSLVDFYPRLIDVFRNLSRKQG